MKRLFLTATIAMAFAAGVTAQNVKATVHADKAGATLESLQQECIDQDF